MKLIGLLIALLIFPATSSAAKLSWSAPNTAGMTTIWVPPTGLDVTLDVTKDFELVFPGRTNHLGVPSPWVSQPVAPIPGAGCVRVDGGRIVQIIGGECLIPPQGTPYNSKTRRCFAFNDVRWILFVEGVWCHGDVLDGIEMYDGGGATGATIEIQNSRFEDITARDEDLFTDGHPDGIYLSASGTTPGAKAVRVDRVTIVTDYQGLFFSPPATGVGCCYPIDLRNTNVRGTPETGNHLQQLLWRADAKNKMTLSNVILEPQMLGNGTYETLIKALKPSDIDPVVANRAFWVDATTVGWPAAANIVGVVKQGPPIGGDNVPVGVAGSNYVSPGYNF